MFSCQNASISTEGENIDERGRDRIYQREKKITRGSEKGKPNKKQEQQQATLRHCTQNDVIGSAPAPSKRIISCSRHRCYGYYYQHDGPTCLGLSSPCLFRSYYYTTARCRITAAAMARFTMIDFAMKKCALCFVVLTHLPLSGAAIVYQ